MYTKSSFSILSLRNALLGGAALALLATVGAGTANATVFGGTVSFSDPANGNDLQVVSTTSSLTAVAANGTFSTTNLTAGTSDYMTGFMGLNTKDSASGWNCVFSCTNSDPVALTFIWSSPSSAANTTFAGIVQETTFWYTLSDTGSLIWSGEAAGASYAEKTVVFSDGAVAVVDLYNSYLTGTTSSLANQFDVKIRDVKDVPEPMTLALVGSGLIGLGAVRHRRTAHQA